MDEAPQHREKHWLLRLILFGALIFVLILVAIFQPYNLDLAIIGLALTVILILLKEKKTAKQKFPKIQVARIIAHSDTGEQMGLKSPEQLNYSPIDGRPAFLLLDIDEENFVYMYNDDVGKPVGVLARNFIDEDNIEFFEHDLTPEIQNLGPADIIALAERYVLGTGVTRNKNQLKRYYGVTTDEELAEKIAGKSFTKKHHIRKSD